MSTRFNLHRVAWRILTKVHVRRAGLQLGNAVELALVLPLENHDDDWRLLIVMNTKRKVIESLEFGARQNHILGVISLKQWKY